MGNSKVIFGNETLIDLTGDTVTPDTLLAGTTAHNRSGEQIVGTATVPEELDDLTDVTLTSPADGDLLQRDGNGKWVNSAKIPQKVAGLQKTGCVNVAPNKATSQVISGVTFTANTNGSVGMVGTNSGGNINYLLSELTPVAGEYALVKNPTPNCYLVAHALRNGSHVKNIITLAGDETKGTAVIDYDGYDTVRLVAWIQSGLAVDTTITYMLTPDLSATYADYQPYSMTNRELTEVAVTRSELNVTINTDILTTNSAVRAVTYGQFVYVVFDVNIKTAGLTNPIIATGLPKPYQSRPPYGFTSIGLPVTVTTEGLKILGTPQTGWAQGSIIYLID